jgi:hypothetical protein
MIAQIVVHNITNLWTRQNPPCILKWKVVPTSTSTDEDMMYFIVGNADDLNKNAVRISSRPKRTLITRNEDFFMDNEHIKNSVVYVSGRSGNCVRCKHTYEYNQNDICDRNKVKCRILK